ncbi:hypothetical protein F4814DRAFT_453665 [Daldinia grandis]|nr:hypothetical protein F4814DRAFT_453665 [Daldinia grandis]
MPEPQLPLKPTAWHEVVLKQKYNDPRKLKNTLDSLYGNDNYKIKSGRYILQLPEPLDEVT